MNFTAQALPHTNYVRGVNEPRCRLINQLGSKSEYCRFIQTTSSCHEGDYFFDYTKILFCDLSILELPLDVAFVLLVCWLSVLVLMLCALAYNSLPNLVTLVKHFKLSEANAGATIVVIVNGLPDILQAFFFYDGDTEVLINEMLGVSLYLKAFHAGLLIYFYPLGLHASYFLRDAFAYFCGACIMFPIVAARDTTIFEGIFAMLFYPLLCYVCILQHQSAVDEIQRAGGNKDLSEAAKMRYELTREINIQQYPPTPDSPDPLTVNMYKQLSIVVNPLRSEFYDNSAAWQKFILKAGFIFSFIFKLWIPVINLYLPGLGWSRLLLTINFFLSPLLLLQFFPLDLYTILALLIMGSLFASAIFYVTTPTTPRYLFPLASYGLVCQMLITRVIEAELASVMMTIGNILGFQRQIIGTTLTAWGITIAEIIGWTTLVRWKIEAMPLVGFLVAPIFNNVFSLGLTALLKTITSMSVHCVTRAGASGKTATWFNMLHHCFFTFAVVTTQYRVRKSIGLFSMLIYVTFLVYTFTNQYDLTHAFGTDHVDENLFYSVAWA